MSGAPDLTEAEALAAEHALGVLGARERAEAELRMARDPAAISLVEIVEAMEGPLGMTECSVHAGQCGIEDSCGVRANWRRINDVVSDALRDVSLAQLLLPPATRPARKGIAVQLTNA